MNRYTKSDWQTLFTNINNAHPEKTSAWRYRSYSEMAKSVLTEQMNYYSVQGNSKSIPLFHYCMCYVIR